MAVSGDEQSVGAFAPDTADPMLGYRVGPRRPHRRADDPDTGRGEHRIERRREPGVPISHFAQVSGFKINPWPVLAVFGTLPANSRHAGNGS
ncbi:hypothetical protein GCM10023075_35990 [Streptosporangium album]|uniref:hypothetical protein n=1 Tax=Streptosporangium album TaxID=47479 RepID=UPI0031E506FB